MQDTATAPHGLHIIMASDHAGRELKNRIRDYLVAAGNQVDDLTPQTEGSLDYPELGEQLGRRVVATTGTFGVAVCGTGIGISIAANKVPGVRAAIAYSPGAAEMARRHNDANVIAFGGRTMDFDTARAALDAFFAAQFEGGRHARRVQMIADIERRPGRD